MELAFVAEGFSLHDWTISPLEGEMPGRAEGGALAPLSRPSVATAFTLDAESPRDIAQRDALLDRAMGPRWRRKSSEKIRRGRLPSQGLAFVARDEGGRVVGTVRLWDVSFDRASATPGRALMLGPLAVDPSLKSAGIGSVLMRHALVAAARLGHGAILLVGDAAYYQRFGFSADRTGNLAMPGPFEKHRFLALELATGALDGARGVLKPAGRKVEAGAVRAAA